MKRFLWLLLAVFLLPIASRAQNFTQVTACITDPNSLPYSFGTISAVLTPSSPGGYTLGGFPYSGRLAVTALDSNGCTLVQMGSNTAITPAGSQWFFTVNIPGIQPPFGTGPQSFTATISISGASQNISATLSALAPALSHFAIGGSVTSVSCGTLTSQFTCSVTNPNTTPAIAFSAVTTGASVLDCSQQPGADMGAKLNACIAALPASGGIADSTKFSSPQTISTAVVNNKPVQIQTCGIAITQTANISLTAVNAAWHGCPDQSTVITKGANIDQITMSANYTSVDYVTLAGASASFTGNGITENGASQTYVANNKISDEASAGIFLTGSDNWGIIQNNDLSGYVLHAIQEASGSSGFEFWITHNKMEDTATATGSTAELAATVLFTENDVENAHGFLAVHNTNANTNASVYSGNFLQSIGGTGGTAISVSGFDYIHHNTMYNTGAFPILIGGGTITDNNLQDTSGGSDIIQVSNRAFITGNIVNDPQSGAGHCGINLITTGGMVGTYVGHNYIQMGGTGSGANYGICLTTVAAAPANNNVIESNLINSNTGAGAGSAGVFFNNSAGITTAGGNNVFRTNECNGITNCVARTDAQNLQNYYENNSGVNSTLFLAGGSTNDVIIQTLGNNGVGITFANLPTAGNGSQIYTTDATCASVAAAGGTGCLLFRVNGAWTGNESIVGSDTHTTVVTGNYGPVTLLPSTAPTGSYLLTVYVEVTTGVAASTITTSAAYHDDTGANTQSGAALNAAATGAIQSLTFPIRFVTGTALTYSTSTANSPQYKIFARVEAQ